ncbi:MAG: GIY-YIG nuclease family protein [Alphaproteobacteria bacterium]
MTNHNHGIIYVGVTSDLVKRIWQHKNKTYKKSFTAKYDLSKLVYYEIHDDPTIAIKREKRLQNWDRQWKLDLIEDKNPDWIDLWDEVVKKAS